MFYFIVDDRLTTTNHVLLVVGVILWSVASIVGVTLSVIKLKTHKWQINNIYFIFECITAVLSLVFWVIVGIHVALQTSKYVAYHVI